MTYLSNVDENGVVVTPFTVYKEAREFIIELSLPEGTLTNLQRSGVIKIETAKFRCNQAVVISITSKKNNEQVETVKSNFDINFEYTVGHNDMYVVC